MPASESSGKPTVRRMFGPDVSVERVRELMKNPDFIAHSSLVQLGTQLNQRQESDPVFATLYDLYDAARFNALEALSARIYAARWTGAEFSAAAMVADGLIVLE